MQNPGVRLAALTPSIKGKGEPNPHFLVPNP
jgi:hypothetical protein